MSLGHTIEERLGADDVEILTTHLCTLSSDAGNLCLCVGIISHIHPCIGAQLQLAFFLKLIVCLRSSAMYNFRTSITNGCITSAERKLLPFLDVSHSCRQLRYYFEQRTFAEIAVRFTILIYMNQVITPFLGILCINSCPFQRLCIEKHRVSAASLHKERLIGTYLVKK